MTSLGHNERGFSLIIAVIVLVFLTLLATTGLQFATDDNQAAGNNKQASNALYVAEAGCAWGAETLRTNPLYNLNSPSKTFNDVFAAIPTALTDGSALMADENPDDGLTPAWYEIPNPPSDFGTGNSFRVAISDDKDSGTDPTFRIDTNNRILMRCLGQVSSGATTSRRMLELTLRAQ